MKRIKLAFVFLIVALTALWILADPVLFSQFDLTSLQVSLVYYSGIIAIGVISAGMILVVRSAKINIFLGGLDKSYRLHKWLGIAGLATSTIHWALVNFPKWLLGWEAMALPPPQGSPILELFRSQYALAAEIGDWFFKVFVILVVLALVKRFPYRYFFKTHRPLAIVFLLLAFHSVVMMKFDYWSEMIAPIMLVLVAGGTLAAFISLFRRIGHRRRVVGVIDEIVFLKGRTPSLSPRHGRIAARYSF
jgi:predicted ferric reductase